MVPFIRPKLLVSAVSGSSLGIPVLLVMLTLAACASSENVRVDEGNLQQTGNRIVVSELSVPVGGMTAYDIVSSYKPQWLQKNGYESIQNEPEIQVYVDAPGSSIGPTEELRRINALAVESIEYFNGREAQFRFGIGNSVGAILVHTKSGP